MIMILFIFLGVNLIIMVKMSNPIKASFNLLILSISIFLYFFIFSGSSWFSLIFFMLFIGGIMIMFMVLSSLLPNEKSMKLKMFMFFSFLIIIFNFSNLFSSQSFEILNTFQMKLSFQNSWSFEMLMLAILLYFLSFIYIISKESSSLRSTLT